MGSTVSVLESGQVARDDVDPGLVGAFLAERTVHRRNAGFEARRQRALRRFLDHTLPRAPYYAALAARTGRDRLDLADLPVVDKRTVLGDFAAFNTRGITLTEALAVAEAAERSRDFSPTLPDGTTVGLSSGTSGTRGVFLVSPAESRRWAGILLGQLIAPTSLRTLARRPLRIALFLRADSNLYRTLGSSRVRFSWHDLAVPLEQHVAALPGTDVIVAPAGVLRRLAELSADAPGRVRPLQVVSVAETLEPDDETMIAAAFGCRVEQVYQATEGLLAVSCPAGRLHLNEAHLHVEPEWLDHRRFHPVITDFTRTTQLVVRHRLDDVLLAAPGPCPCGRPGRSITGILGRADDVLHLRRNGGAAGTPVPVYPDVLRHAVALAGDLGDYRIEQHGTQWRLATRPGRADAATVSAVGREVAVLAARLDAEPPELVAMDWPGEDPTAKRRRIRRVSG
ncbi:hypothetical protein KG112_03535 [Nocardioides sp. zg-ZUI104]|uniref:F390 synthetase-related protein n=1 Tax=Nocardioides faecalis TaxID=2803858 RepID=UPI001BCD7A8F|nr:F390 synthetase-related protein [Nocardioides faecalis]MBS4751879.1 hypothetical protein [Nocardioides faecalis]